ncbi:MAG: hypothetical protein V4708_01735 [Bacteroidota bacterium]
MKKLILIMALNVAAIASSAQIAKVALKPADKAATPQVVLDSIKKAFPKPISQTLSAITAQNYGKEWEVEISPASAEESPLYYQLLIHNKSGRYTAVYDRNGNLLKLKQIFKNASLPEQVSHTLQTKYSDWKVLDKEERISNDGKNAYTEYKVMLKKGPIKKAVYLNETGKVKFGVPSV